MADQDYLKRLRDALLSQSRYHEPWATGVVKLAGPETSLFFTSKGNLAGRINLEFISDSDIETLTDACEPAPFGRGPESVLDDTYRKAGKIDYGDFLWGFNPDSGQFTAQLAQCLCPWQSDHPGKGIRVEPYKLNVYGKGGFFKKHQDTPRAENMFGSLVFVLPTSHQGGNLVLRHQARKFNFDAPSVLSASSSPNGSVAWVAFYSDVEHEVLEVSEGARITITYNLYFDPTRAAPIQPNTPLRVPDNPFTSTLRELFRDAAFVRKYNYLGFGLEHKYPRELRENQFWHLHKCLKGPDAFLYRVLKEAGLEPSLQLMYRNIYDDCGFWILSEKMIEGRSYNDGGDNDNGCEHLIEMDEDAKVVWRPGESEETASRDAKRGWHLCYFNDKAIAYYRARTIQVDWVTPVTTNLAGYTEYSEWGNEPNQEYFYYNVCLVINARGVPCSR